MQKQPVYQSKPADVNSVCGNLFKVGICQPADPWKILHYISPDNQSMLCGSLRCLKQLKSRAAKGVLKVRALCGHCFTQAQHLMHLLLSVLHSLPFAMAPDGHIVAQ